MVMRIPTEPRPFERKYGRDHWAGCECEDCVAAFNTHNHGNDSCYCDSCTMHRTNRTPREEARIMAGVNICDRCEAMVKGNALGEVTIRTSQERDHETITVELCPDCVAQTVTWAEQTDATPIRKAYKNAWRRAESKSEDTLTDAVRKAVRAELESGEHD